MQIRSSADYVKVSITFCCTCNRLLEQSLKLVRIRSILAHTTQRWLGVTPHKQKVLQQLYVYKALNQQSIGCKCRFGNLPTPIGHGFRTVVCIWTLYSNTLFGLYAITHTGYGNFINQSRNYKGLQHYTHPIPYFTRSAASPGSHAWKDYIILGTAGHGTRLHFEFSTICNWRIHNLARMPQLTFFWAANTFGVLWMGERSTTRKESSLLYHRFSDG